jgi:hypothetical protein
MTIQKNSGCTHFFYQKSFILKRPIKLYHLKKVKNYLKILSVKFKTFTEFCTGFFFDKFKTLISKDFVTEKN